MNDFFATYLPLPLSVKGAVLPTPEGDYQIIINSAYDTETQREIFNHEMRHILMGHLHGTANLADAEAAANNSSLLSNQIETASLTGISARQLIPNTKVNPTYSGNPCVSTPTKLASKAITPLPTQSIVKTRGMRHRISILTNQQL